MRFLIKDSAHSALFLTPGQGLCLVGSGWSEHSLTATVIGIESCMFWTTIYTKWPTQ